ncbi:MAG: cytochrome C [Desulfobacterales bacterium]|nr:MAG: cytochrome C [Desulfobacterales bacterium]
MKKLFIFFAALVLLAGFSGISIAGIVGSMHDFSFDTWSKNQICLPCHTPHNAESVEGAPLWNHALSQANYQMYSSPTMNAQVPGSPTGSSKLCLSCHDGTVSLDAFGGGDNSGIFITGDANLGTNLSNDHPISIVYNDQLAAADPGLWDPTAKQVTIGSGNFTQAGTIQEVLLDANSELQCSACHAVHNDYVADPDDPFNYFLKISVGNSDLCMTCHNK